MVFGLYGSFEPAADDIDVEKKPYVSETSAEFPTDRQWTVRRNTRLVLIAIVVVCLFASPLILNSTSTLNNQSAFHPILSLLIGDTLFQGSNSKTDVDFETYFGIVRKGYEASAHFGPSRDEVVKYAFLDNYNTLIEPYSEMEISLISDTDVKEIDTIEFEICSDKDETNCYEGEFSPSEVGSFTVECDPFDEFTVNIKGFDSSGDKIVTSTGSAVCIYVRREIQSLTGDDLDATLNAMHTLWTTSEEEGQKKYGENYHSAEYFTTAHHFNAGQQESDHIHEGVGFIAQHIKLTNVFEKAMQSVDPSVSLP
jgi:hypothetical protein